MNEPAARPITRPVRLSITSPLWQPRARIGSSDWRISIANGATDRRDRDRRLSAVDDGSHAMARPRGMNSAMLRLMSLIRRGQRARPAIIRDRSHVYMSGDAGAEPAMDRRQGRDEDDGHRVREQPCQPRPGPQRVRQRTGAQTSVTARARTTPGQNQMTPFIDGRRRDPAAARPRRRDPATLVRAVTPGRPCAIGNLPPGRSPRAIRRHAAGPVRGTSPG